MQFILWKKTMDFHFLEKTGRNVRLSPYGLEIKKYIDVIFKQLGRIRTDHL